MPEHTRVNADERYRIATLLSENVSIREIARRLKRSPSTISQEIKRNSIDGLYDPETAHRMTLHRQKHKKKKENKITPEIAQYIDELLAENLSPAQISLRLKRVKKISIHMSTIYRYINQK